MKKRRTRRRPSPLGEAAAEVKRRKLQFERDASYILSTALGFGVTVKIKQQLIQPPPKTVKPSKAQRLATAKALYAPPPPEWPQIGERTVCQRCDQELEWTGEEWHDRGGDATCGPYKGQDGEIVPEDHTKPHIVAEEENENEETDDKG